MGRRGSYIRSEPRRHRATPEQGTRAGATAGNSSGAAVDNLQRGAFSLDTTDPGAASGGYDAFRRGWETQLRGGFQVPAFSRTTTGDFRIRGRVASVRGVMVADLHAASPTRTASTPRGLEDLVRMYVVRHGSWTLHTSDRGEHTVSTGQAHLGFFGHPPAFETVPHTVSQFLFLPSAMLKPIVGDRSITGPADSAEVRLLVAHSNMLHATVADLSPAGVDAACNTLIELVRAVALRRFDDVEPRLVPALTEAAKDLANAHLADHELSPMMLARELKTSVRTLQRAFAAVGESVSTYIRHRRLEEARLALTLPANRLSVSEIAAHWQFADSSHFIRAFKKYYGQTPTEYARAAYRRGPDRPDDAAAREVDRE